MVLGGHRGTANAGSGYEAGLGFAVRLNKGPFLGRAALERCQSGGITRRLCCLSLDDPAVVVMGKEPILHGDRVLSYVTSAKYGYTLGQSIAYGYLPADHATEGTVVEVLSFGKRHPATVRRDPLCEKGTT